MRLTTSVSRYLFLFGLNLYHCAVLLVSSLCASTVARTKIFKNKLKIVMCGVSPENYSQMELSHDDELVDNNQNQNLKLVKHTLRNQVCDFVFFEVFIVGNSISMKSTIRTNGTFICTYTLIQI